MSNPKLKDAVEYSSERISYSDLSVDTYVSTENILANKQGVEKITQLPTSLVNTPKYCVGDILVSNIRPYLKKIFYARNEGGASSDVLIFKVKKDFDSKFIYYNLFQDSFFEYMMAGSKGTKMPRGDKRQILDFDIPKIDIHSQQKIAAVLSALDEKIELNNQINAELKQMAKALYDYWFVQFDFPDVSGKPYKSSGGKMVYDEVLKRVIPEGWEMKRLQEIVYANRNQIDAKTSWTFINYLDTSNITDNHIKDIVALDFKNIPSRAKRIVEVNDVIFSTVRPNQRHFGIIKNPVVNMVVSTGFTVLSHKSNKIYNNFIYQFLSSDNIVNYLHNIAQNSVSSYPSINPDDILNLSLCIPGKNNKILDRISKELDVIYQKVSLNQKQNKELADLRDWLLPMLMNGQVKVTGNTASEGSDISIPAESQTDSGTIETLNMPANRKAFAKQVLAGKIVSTFITDPNFTDIKFQKILFLAEHLIEADLNLNYYYQAAGPYDNKFMHTIYNDFRRQRWFDRKSNQFVPLEKHEKIEEYYQVYFASAGNQLYRLFELLYPATEAKAEIIATLYAVWNNRIIEGKIITDDELLADFYQWSYRKQQYTREQVLLGLEWLRTHQMEPRGFGKLIKKAKSKKII